MTETEFLRRVNEIRYWADRANALTNVAGMTAMELCAPIPEACGMAADMLAHLAHDLGDMSAPNERLR